MKRRVNDFDGAGEIKYLPTVKISTRNFLKQTM